MPSIFHLDAIWEHTLTGILNHDNKSEVGIIIRTWVKHHKLDDFSSLFNHSPDKFTPSSPLSYDKEKADSEVLLEMPSTPLQELQNIRKYIQHLMDAFDYDYDYDDFDDPLSEHNWLSQTRGKFMKYVIYILSDSTESRPISNQKQKLASFKKGIKREEAAYPTLKDERYFDGFSRSLYITAKSHECEQVLDPDYTPSNAEKDLFEAKQIFMFSVFDKHLLTDMGKPIVRKYVHTTDAQSVWKDYQDHMKSSSKGASEKRRLTQYVTNTTLDDNYKCTTEQFVLHFHAHSAMEPGKTISMSKLHQITGHTGEHLLRPTANYMRIKLTGKLAPCEVCAQAKIRQMNVSKKKMKKLPTRPGYRVFMDICSFKQVSRGGNRHWLIVVDEFSDCTHSFFLNKKSNQIKIIPMWIKGL